MTFNKVSEVRWESGTYKVQVHKVGGHDKFSAWNGNRIIGYRDSLHEAEQACRFDQEEIN